MPKPDADLSARIVRWIRSHHEAPILAKRFDCLGSLAVGADPSAPDGVKVNGREGMLL